MIQLKRILVPTDFSEQSGWALSYATDESRTEAVRNHFNNFLEEHGFKGVTVVVKTGNPGLGITEYAK